jgi:hypothetical protein
MEKVIIFLEEHFTGIFIAILLLLGLALFLNWLFWIFGWGRHKVKQLLPGQPAPKGGFLFIFAELMVKIINDFRHFLAFALGYAFYVSNGDPSRLSDALQAVVATLGGLIGSIVGYYFGESKAIAQAQGGGTSGGGTTGSSTVPPVLPGGALSGGISAASAQTITPPIITPPALTPATGTTNPGEEDPQG